MRLAVTPGRPCKVTKNTTPAGANPICLYALCYAEGCATKLFLL